MHKYWGRYSPGQKFMLMGVWIFLMFMVPMLLIDENPAVLNPITLGVLCTFIASLFTLQLPGSVITREHVQFLLTTGKSKRDILKSLIHHYIKYNTVLGIGIIIIIVMSNNRILYDLFEISVSNKDVIIMAMTILILGIVIALVSPLFYIRKKEYVSQFPFLFMILFNAMLRFLSRYIPRESVNDVLILGTFAIVMIVILIYAFLEYKRYLHDDIG